MRISPNAVVRVLLACTTGLVVAGIATQIAIRFTTTYLVEGLASNFDLNGEGTVPSWFSSLCLFGCAFVLFSIGWIRLRQRDPLRWHWLGIAAVFGGLSMDESISLHEAFVVPLRNAYGLTGIFYWAWVIPGMAFVLVFCLATYRFVFHLPRQARWAFCRAGIIFCSGSLGMEMVSAKFLSDGLSGDSLGYVAMYVVEESLEMLGAILFLGALLEYARENIGGVTIAWADAAAAAPEQSPPRAAARATGSGR